MPVKLIDEWYRPMPVGRLMLLLLPGPIATFHLIIRITLDNLSLLTIDLHLRQLKITACTVV